MIAPIKDLPAENEDAYSLYGAVACVWAEEHEGAVRLSTVVSSREDAACREDLAAILADNGAVCFTNNSALFSSALMASNQHFRGVVLDAMDVMQLCIPSAYADSLEELLCELLNDDSLKADSACLSKAWMRMSEIMLKWPLPVVDAMQQFCGVSSSPGVNDLLFRLGNVIRKRGRAPAGLGESFPFRDVSFVKREIIMHHECALMDAAEVSEVLGPRGEFAVAVRGYEHRPGQVDMARAVAESINTQSHLMVEAGTGVGKSLAYLVPAAFWSRSNSMPVVVSTNTKNLQAQLCDKDLPSIQRLMMPELRFSILKGRGNYLCLRRVQYVLSNREDELSDAESLSMVYVMAWLASTNSGDLDEIRHDWLCEGAGGLLWQIGSRAEECPGRSCRHYGRCFLQGARAKAWASDIIVANHSLVFSDMGSRSPVLPPHRQMIFDEAHNLEEAATRHFSVEISAKRLRLTLRRLWRRYGRSGRGLLRSLTKQIQGGRLSSNATTAKRLNRACTAAKTQVELLGGEMGAFFDAIGKLLPNDGVCSRRLKSDVKDVDEWADICEARKVLLSHVGQLAQALDALADIMKEAADEEMGFAYDATSELAAASLWMREFSADVEFVMSLDSDEHVFWIERGGGKYASPEFWAAPLRVGTQLSEQLYAQKDSVIFCSATLSVGGKFSFMKNRLGVDKIPEDRLNLLQAESPFDYTTQCLVLVPVFLPDPAASDGEYTRELAALLADLFMQTRGRGLGLFTSYAMLRQCCSLLRPALSASDIRVLSQGEGVSREQLTAVFRKEISSVLMGTHSFWEGVDVMGESLSCVVMARLPFASVGDPIIEARCEQVEREGRSSFIGFSLPNAVIRFRQGFGRLIRHRGDKGVVVVTDSRIITKRYGWAFRHSLPCRTISCTSKEQFMKALHEALPM